MTASNSAIARLSDAWSARTPRERLMLAVMAVAIAAVVLWFAVISPLLTWRRDAIEDYGDAKDDEGREDVARDRSFHPKEVSESQDKAHPRDAAKGF